MSHSTSGSKRFRIWCRYAGHGYPIVFVVGDGTASEIMSVLQEAVRGIGL